MYFEDYHSLYPSAPSASVQSENYIFSLKNSVLHYDNIPYFIFLYSVYFAIWVHNQKNCHTKTRTTDVDNVQCFLISARSALPFFVIIDRAREDALRDIPSQRLSR